MLKALGGQSTKFFSPMVSMMGLTSVECRQFSVRGSSFSFPKHKELLTEDFYDDEAHDVKNPYGKR